MVKKKTEGSLWIYITMPVKEKKKKKQINKHIKWWLSNGGGSTNCC